MFLSPMWNGEEWLPLERGELALIFDLQKGNGVKNTDLGVRVK